MPPELTVDDDLSVPLASECEHLVVGQTYLVPCVSGLPVIGDPHIDDDHFNSTPEHWHVDSRFENDACAGFPQTCAVRTHDWLDDALMSPKLEPRVCLRESPLIWDANDQEDRVGMMMIALIVHYSTMKAKCGVCPHRGMPIQNGVCTGHRLQWLPDGAARFKPPFTLRIKDTKNFTVLEPGVEHKFFKIPIVEEVRGPLIIELYDGSNECVAVGSYRGTPYLCVGDTLNLNFKKAGYA